MVEDKKLFEDAAGFRQCFATGFYVAGMKSSISSIPGMVEIAFLTIENTQVEKDGKPAHRLDTKRAGSVLMPMGIAEQLMNQLGTQLDKMKGD